MFNLLYILGNILRNNLIKFKGILFKLFLLSHGCKVGKGLRCHSFPRFRISPKKNIFIGNNVTIGYNVTFEILKNGSLFIGDQVKLTQNIILSAGSNISIGEYSLIGENVSIRDGDHNTGLELPITLQSSIYLPVNIGIDVWIGAGCHILKGSNIPNGDIIAANSVVLKSSKLEKNTIYGGSPALKIGIRQ